jgi:predicted aconitase with swiveling domain
MFSVTDSAAEAVTLTATDSTDTVVLTQQPQVVFQQSAPSATSSTISPATATSPADGTTQTLITVVIKDQFGAPLSGKTVQLAASPSGTVQFHPIAVGSATPGVTDPTGTAEFEVDDTVAESVTLTATDTTDSFQVSGNSVVSFTAGAADANLSTVTTNPTSVPSDGTTASTITVTINDHFGNHIAGKAVTVKAVNGSSVLTTVAGTTNQSGQATFTATDATAEVVTYSATDSTDSLPLTGEGVITFGSPPAPPPVPADSSVVANPTSDPADGSTPAMITVKLYDGNGQPVPGKVVTLSASAGSSKVTAVSGTSDNTGTATFSVSDATPESVTYTATDTTDKVVLTGVTAVVTFTAVTATNPATTPSSGGGASVASNAGTASDSSGGSGTSSSGGSGSSLATTGAPAFLPWLIGLGLLFMCIGTIGRRLFAKRAA